MHRRQDRESGGGLAAAEAAAVCVEFGGVTDVEEDALDLQEEGTAAAVEADASGSAGEEVRVEVVLEEADAVGYGGGGDAELAGGMGKALVACGGLEEGEAVEGREGFHGAGGLRGPGIV